MSKQVGSHLHADLGVTPRRVDDFANAHFSDQLLVLAEIRRRAGDSSNGTQLAIAGIALAAFGLFVSPAKGLNLFGLPFAAALVLGAILGVAGALVALPFIIRPTVRSIHRERALVWLPAYEDALARRRFQKGRAARKWRRAH
jgi:hypothetical protein